MRRFQLAITTGKCGDACRRHSSQICICPWYLGERETLEGWLILRTRRNYSRTRRRWLLYHACCHSCYWVPYVRYSRISVYISLMYCFFVTSRAHNLPQLFVSSLCSSPQCDQASIERYNSCIVSLRMYIIPISATCCDKGGWWRYWSSMSIRGWVRLFALCITRSPCNTLYGKREDTILTIKTLTSWGLDSGTIMMMVMMTCSCLHQLGVCIDISCSSSIDGVDTQWDAIRECRGSNCSQTAAPACHMSLRCQDQYDRPHIVSHHIGHGYSRSIRTVLLLFNDKQTVGTLIVTLTN